MSDEITTLEDVLEVQDVVKELIKDCTDTVKHAEHILKLAKYNKKAIDKIVKQIKKDAYQNE